MKECSRCGIEKPKTEFHKHSVKPSGTVVLRSWCKKCKNKQSQKETKELQSTDEGRKQKYYWQIKSKYGLSREEYDAMLENQGGGCAICGDTSSKLCVDHCHSSGKVRGILCDDCNLSLGKMGDDANRLRKAANYLEDNNE